MQTMSTITKTESSKQIITLKEGWEENINKHKKLSSSENALSRYNIYMISLKHMCDCFVFSFLLSFGTRNNKGTEKKKRWKKEMKKA